MPRKLREAGPGPWFVLRRLQNEGARSCGLNVGPGIDPFTEMLGNVGYLI